MKFRRINLPLPGFVALRADAPAFDCAKHGRFVYASGGSGSCETIGHGPSPLDKRLLCNVACKMVNACLKCDGVGGGKQITASKLSSPPWPGGIGRWVCSGTSGC